MASLNEDGKSVSLDFNSAEEDEDWSEEDCVGEWHPTATAFVIA